MLLERGIILPKGRINLMHRLEDLMTGDPAVSARTRTLLTDLRDEWAGLDQRIQAYDDELAELTREDVQARRLATIPGIGVITALLAAIGDGSAFAKGRDLAARFGLTPRQHSTGGKTKLLGISKRGNGYLRKQLIHGARAPCRTSLPSRISPVPGCKICWPTLIPPSWWSRWRRNWRVSLGQCWRNQKDFDRQALVVA